MDLLSASVEKLEPLPAAASASGNHGNHEADAAWLEEMEERAQRGVSDAQFSLGQYHYHHGNYVDALRLFEMAEVGGNTQAKYQLGVMYYDGVGVGEDMSKGFSYMLEVAQSQKKRDSHVIPSAQYNVGRAYFQGFGVRQSDSEAERWWVLAAGRGRDVSSTRAQNTLGMFYARQESLDLNKSFYWHSEAAENGDLESMASLGEMLLHGEGCGKEEGLGLQWLKRSAEGGCVHGTGLLALHYYTRKLFSKAAETAFRVSEVEEAMAAGVMTPLDRRGTALGCFVLARCLQLGQAVSRNEQKADEYFTKAKNYDKVIVAELHSQLTHGQL